LLIRKPILVPVGSEEPALRLCHSTRPERTRLERAVLTLPTAQWALLIAFSADRSLLPLMCGTTHLGAIAQRALPVAFLADLDRRPRARAATHLLEALRVIAGGEPPGEGASTAKVADATAMTVSSSEPSSLSGSSRASMNTHTV